LGSAAARRDVRPEPDRGRRCGCPPAHGNAAAGGRRDQRLSHALPARRAQTCGERYAYRKLAMKAGTTSGNSTATKITAAGPASAAGMMVTRLASSTTQQAARQ